MCAPACRGPCISIICFRRCYTEELKPKPVAGAKEFEAARCKIRRRHGRGDVHGGAPVLLADGAPGTPQGCNGAYTHAYTVVRLWGQNTSTARQMAACVQYSFALSKRSCRPIITAIDTVSAFSLGPAGGPPSCPTDEDSQED